MNASVNSNNTESIIIETYKNPETSRKEIADFNSNDVFLGLLALLNGNTIISKSASLDEIKSITLLELDHKREIIRELPLHFDSPRIATFSVDSNGNYLLGGQTQENLENNSLPEKRSFLLKVSPQFVILNKMLWSYPSIIPICIDSICVELCQGHDQFYYAIIEQTCLNKYKHTYLLKLNSDLNVLDSIEIPYHWNDDAPTLTFLSNNNILVAIGNLLIEFDGKLNQIRIQRHPKNYFTSKLRLGISGEIISAGHKKHPSPELKNIGFIAIIDPNTLQIIDEHLVIAEGNSNVDRLTITDIVVGVDEIFYCVSLTSSKKNVLRIYHLAMHDFSSEINFVTIKTDTEHHYQNAKLAFGLKDIVCAFWSTSSNSRVNSSTGWKLNLKYLPFFD